MRLWVRLGTGAGRPWFTFGGISTLRDVDKVM